MITDEQYKAYKEALAVGDELWNDWIFHNGEFKDVLSERFFHKVQAFLETCGCKELAEYFNPLLPPDWNE